MAIFRKIHTSFWSDPFIGDLDNEQRLFYLYLLTNERTKQCGIYEISKRQICYELGFSLDKVSKMLAYFVRAGKIMYSESTQEVALKNWMKFNGSTSPKVLSCIKTELCSVKNTLLIEYVNSMYTPSQEEQEEEEEQEQEKGQKVTTPTLQDCILFFTENNRPQQEAEAFFNYYESINWKRGKNKITKWKLAAAGWIKRDYNNQNNLFAPQTTVKPIKASLNDE